MAVEVVTVISMRGTISLGTIGGIPVSLHVTFALALLWAGGQGAVDYGGVAGALFGTLAAALLFACVLLHELAHCAWARACGATVRGVVLTPVGGVARLDAATDDPQDELRVALAGPLVNLALALLLGGVLLLALAPAAAASPGVLLASALRTPSLSGLLIYLMIANLLLVGFNLLPAFPLDGGRVMRALLATRLPYHKATRWASRAGQGVAVALALIGVVGLRLPEPGAALNLSLIVMALVVFAGAVHENWSLRVQATLYRATVGQVCRPAMVTVAPGDAISAAVTEAWFAAQTVLPVVVGRRKRLVGAVRRGDVPAAPATVAAVMRTDYPVARRRAPLWTAVDAMDQAGVGEVIVVEGGRLSGLVSQADVHRAARAPRARTPALRPQSAATGP